MAPTQKEQFRENLARGRAFEERERSGWAHEASKLEIEASTRWKQKRGRIDIKIKESDSSVSVVELKATDWDKIKSHRIRSTALAHARQVWRYVNDLVLSQGKEVCPGVIYEREPSDSSIRNVVENALHERCVQVVWRNWRFARLAV